MFTLGDVHIVALSATNSHENFPHRLSHHKMFPLLESLYHKNENTVLITGCKALGSKDSAVYI